MEGVVYKVEALDPWDGDTYEIGTFADKKIAEYVRKKYEYVTDTGYPKATITEVVLNDNGHYLLDSPEESAFSRVGYFAVLDSDGKFVMYRDKVAFKDEMLSCYDIEMNNLIGKFDYFKVLAVESNDEDINLLYTEVPYYEDDKKMETEASDKFIKYIENK